MSSPEAFLPEVQVVDSGTPASEDGGAVSRGWPQFSARFPPGCAWFDGHFPGRPVLPGVALLALVRAAVERLAPEGLDRVVTGFGWVRFREPVLPGQWITATLRTGREPNTMRFSFERQGKRLCEGIARIGPGDPEAKPDRAAWQWIEDGARSAGEPAPEEPFVVPPEEQPGAPPRGAALCGGEGPGGGAVGGGGPGGAPAGIGAIQPVPLLGAGDEPDVSRQSVLEVARRLAASSQRILCVSSPDRAAVAAAALAAFTSGRRVLLAHIPDETARATLDGAIAGLECLTASHAAALWTRDAAEAVADWAAPSEEAAPADWAATAATEAVRGADGSSPVIGLLTGGTTGTPKILWKPAASLLGEVRLWRERLAVTPEDVVLATVTPLHIYGLIHSVLLPVLGGARVVRGTPFLPAEVERLAAAVRPTVLVTSPPHLRLLLARRTPLVGLRLVLSSGTRLSPDIAEAAVRAWGAPVVEIYGSTETGAVATRCRAAGEESFAPLPTVHLWLEGDGIRVRSPYLAAALPLDEEGAYRVADRVAPDSQGGFRLLGRVDDVLKIAGKRVDLADIEGRVRALPEVQDVAVIAVPSAGTRQVDIGVVAVTDLPEARLARAVRHALRAVVRPRWVLRVDEVDRTSAGKIDRKALVARLAKVQEEETPEAEAPGAEAPEAETPEGGQP